jgi:PAS domain S-box-containing protein
VEEYAIFALDPAGIVVSWNVGAQRLKGYLPEEIIGKHISQFYTAGDRAAGRPQMLLAKAASQGSITDEGWRVRRDGTRFWANVTITVLRDRGELVGFAKVTRDLSARRAAEEQLRQSEERFRLLVQSVEDYAIFLLDPDGRVASWNEGAERIKGYKEAEIIGQHFSVFYPEEDRDKPAREIATALAEGKVEDEGWRIRKDGTRFWADVVITTLRRPNGELFGFAKVTRDLTERHAAEERTLADAKRIASAEAASQAKSEFLAVMSHELRTPLNAIGGYVELLKMGLRGPINDEQLGDLERINLAQRHLLTLINDILNYSRIEAGHLVYDPQPVQLDEVVDTVAAIIEPQTRLMGIEFERDEVPSIGIVVDPVKVEQIILNLLTNALKFTPSGGRIRLSADADESTVTIRVADTGIGVSEEDRERIFEPFVQLGRSLSGGPQGTGLGLAISRDLARGMGGDLHVESSDGEGAAFILEIPRRQPII